MKIIKGVLEEELENAFRQEKAYLKALSELPQGALIKKTIKDNDYYYLIYREGGKVKFLYKGKLSQEEVAKYEEIKKIRAKYKKLLSEVRKQIRFLKRALNAREISNSD